MVKKLLSVALLALLIPISGAFAQGITLSGKVTDSKTGEALPGANIYIEQLQKGASTQPDGTYTITDIPSGTYTVSASYIGFQKMTVSITVGTENLTKNFALKQDMLGLDEVVVTAFGIKRKQRSLGYSIQDVKGDEVDKSKEPNLG